MNKFIVLVCLTVVSNISFGKFMVIPESEKVQKYIGLSLEKRMRLFHAQLIKALEKPSNISKLSKRYTRGLMEHISYSEDGPSFIAFSELHEALHRELFKQKSKNLIPVLMKYNEKFEQFKDTIIHVDVSPYVDEKTEGYLAYQRTLDTAYATFLFTLIQENYTVFEKRFVQHIIDNKQLDIIDRAFFAIQHNWPSYERFAFEHQNSKHQFESLYVFKATDGKIFIASYNDRSLNCDGGLRLFSVDISASPIKVKYHMTRGAFGEGIDISQKDRSGGCAYKADVSEAVKFDGRYLKISGYDTETYREYTFDTERETWQVIPEVSK